MTLEEMAIRSPPLRWLTTVLFRDSMRLSSFTRRRSELAYDLYIYCPHIAWSVLLLEKAPSMRKGKGLLRYRGPNEKRH